MNLSQKNIYENRCHYPMKHACYWQFFDAKSYLNLGIASFDCYVVTIIDKNLNGGLQLQSRQPIGLESSSRLLSQN